MLLMMQVLALLAVSPQIGCDEALHELTATMATSPLATARMFSRTLWEPRAKGVRMDPDRRRYRQAVLRRSPGVPKV